MTFNLGGTLAAALAAVLAPCLPSVPLPALVE